MQDAESSTYHHGDLRTSLISLAHARVRDDGPEAVSLRDLSRIAGVSHAAAYRHFPTREALLDTVAMQGFHELTAVCKEACSQPGDSSLCQLLACGLAYVQFGRRNARLLGLMFDEAGQWLKKEDAKNPRSRAAAELFAVLLGIVQFGQARSEIVVQEPKIVAWTCWAMVHGCASLAPADSKSLKPAERVVIEERIVWSIQTCIRGLQADFHASNLSKK